MILVDTSIWADHFRDADEVLAHLLAEEEVLCHPFVIGEIMMGNPKNRQPIRRFLATLHQATVAGHDEVLAFVERHRLYGTGIGYVDAHLLASAKLSGNSMVWARDRRMTQAAQQLGIAYPGPRLQ